MNLFELQLLAAPLFGGVAGGFGAKSAGFLTMLAGVVIGILIGLGIYFASLGIAALSFSIDANKDKPTRHGYIIGFIGILSLMASPVGAIYLANLVSRSLFG